MQIRGGVDRVLDYGGEPGGTQESAGSERNGAAQTFEGTGGCGSTTTGFADVAAEMLDVPGRFVQRPVKRLSVADNLND